MNMNTSLLAMKFRKGATSSFTAKDYAAVLSTVGWTVEAIKTGRTVEAVKFTAPNGASFTEVKEHGYRRVTFYEVRSFLEEHKAEEAVCELLGLPTHAVEQADKVMYGVNYDLENAGTCPCCFKVQKLGTDGAMVLHGYQRPGDGYTHGRCFGVEHLPLEVSCEGTEALLSNLLVPRAADAAKALASFQAKPPEEMTVNRGSSKKPEYVTITAAHHNGYEFRQAIELLERTLKRNAADTEAAVVAYSDVVANWTTDITPLERRASGVMPKMIKWIMRCF
jgi:hypothetical protein